MDSCETREPTLTLDLCLNTIYSTTMDNSMPVSLVHHYHYGQYMKKVELYNPQCSITGIVKLEEKVRVFTKHIGAVDKTIQFKSRDVKANCLSLVFDKDVGERRSFHTVQCNAGQDCS